ncbi:MAG: DUF6010 family protein [Cyanobacteria bacterium J06598_3]
MIQQLAITPYFWLALGILSAFVFIRLAQAIGKNEQAPNEHTIYAIGLVTAALLYVGFASFNGGTGHWIGVELVGLALYGGVAIAGKHTPWWLVLGWAAHPLWDIGLHVFSTGSTFVPQPYALWCTGFDVLIAIYIAGTQLKAS